jgi:hypothetical protein
VYIPWELYPHCGPAVFGRLRPSVNHHRGVRTGKRMLNHLFSCEGSVQTIQLDLMRVCLSMCMLPVVSTGQALAGSKFRSLPFLPSFSSPSAWPHPPQSLGGQKRQRHNHQCTLSHSRRPVTLKILALTPWCSRTLHPALMHGTRLTYHAPSLRLAASKRSMVPPCSHRNNLPLICPTSPTDVQPGSCQQRQPPASTPC